MSEVTQSSVAYQNNLPSSHTIAALPSINQPAGPSTSTATTLPPLHIPPIKSVALTSTSSTSSTSTTSDSSSSSSTAGANPPHPNVKATTHVTSDGATTSKSNISTPVCKNCKTSTTPLWRRDESGQVLCNACGLFLKLHGRPRPISLKTDVIKSRNRVKNGHQHGRIDPAEARFKERKTSPKPREPSDATQQNQQEPQQSQTSSTNITSPGLVPLLPRNSNGATGSTTPGKLTPNFYPQFHHHLPPHLQQQVPLHHPSSVPTQFASNLNAITSPLLLSTTPKTKVQHHQLSQAHAAAGALENLSQSEHKLSELNRDELRLDDHTKTKPFSPASALSGNGIGSQSAGSSVSKLSSLMNPTSAASNFYSSPSFGPQHSLNNPSAFSLLNGTNSSSSSEPKPPTSNATTADNHDTEIIRLKNRISELELVNDLYKSRIQELETLESQARQREVDLKKKYETLENDEEEDPAKKKIKLEAVPPTATQ